MSLGGSLVAFGSATGPGSGAAIATIPNVPPGFYHIEVVAYLSGTVAAADTDNIRLQVPSAAGGQQNGPQLDLIEVANVATPLQEIGRVQIAGLGSVSVNAIGAGTGTAIYHVLLVLDPVLP